MWCRSWDAKGSIHLIGIQYDDFHLAPLSSPVRWGKIGMSLVIHILHCTTLLYVNHIICMKKAYCALSGPVSPQSPNTRHTNVNRSVWDLVNNIHRISIDVKVMFQSFVPQSESMWCALALVICQQLCPCVFTLTAYCVCTISPLNDNEGIVLQIN